jgi:hypothetical protein
LSCMPTSTSRLPAVGHPCVHRAPRRYHSSSPIIPVSPFRCACSPRPPSARSSLHLPSPHSHLSSSLLDSRSHHPRTHPFSSPHLTPFLLPPFPLHIMRFALASHPPSRLLPPIRRRCISLKNRSYLLF